VVDGGRGVCLPLLLGLRRKEEQVTGWEYSVPRQKSIALIKQYKIRSNRSRMIKRYHSILINCARPSREGRFFSTNQTKKRLKTHQILKQVPLHF
jgi:hypothetical protein